MQPHKTFFKNLKFPSPLEKLKFQNFFANEFGLYVSYMDRFNYMQSIAGRSEFSRVPVGVEEPPSNEEDSLREAQEKEYEKAARQRKESMRLCKVNEYADDCQSRFLLVYKNRSNSAVPLLRENVTTELPRTHC